MDRLFAGLILGFAAGWYIFRTRKEQQDAQATFVFTEVSTENFTVKGDIKSMELKEGRKAVFVAVPKTKGGHTAGYQTGSIRVSSSNPSVVSAELDPTNELGVICKGLDGSANESVVIEIRGDGDPGEGVKEIVGTKSITCTQGDAIVFDLGEPVVTDDEPVEEQPAGTSGTAAGTATGSTAEGGSSATGASATGNADAGATAGGGEAGTGTAAGSATPAGGDVPPNANPGAGDAQPIDGATTAGNPNPVTGTEADSAKPAGDDAAKPPVNG